MSSLVFLCLLGAALAAPANPVSSFFNNAASAVGKEAVDAKTLVAVPVVQTVSNACPDVKSLLGLSYTEMKDDKPDLSSLAIMYINSEVTVRLEMDSAAKLVLSSKEYNSSQNIYLYCHGFTDAPIKKSFGEVSKALYSQGYKNVLALDASKLLAWMYLHSSTYVAYIGERLGGVLADFYHLGVEPSRFHILGHSLGAHIAGFTGKQLYNLTKRHAGRITAMDPAGPCFTNVELGMRINKTDADFLDAIHTDAGVAGLIEPVGHVDFYPNEGMNQPGCFLSDSCSHSRSWHLLAASVRDPTGFPAVHCPEYSDFKKGSCSGIGYMGFGATDDLRGKYYLQTSGESPYSLGMEGTKYQSTQGVVRNITDAVSKTFG